MTSAFGATATTSSETAEIESRKRRDVIDGARRVFFDKGFDGASMDEIARAGGVSKATIYVYFESKEDLFDALVQVDRRKSAELMFEFESDDPDVARQLRRIGVSFMTMMVRPDHIKMVRMVMGVAEKFPRIGQTFFENGPCHGGRRVADMLARHAEHGRLKIDDYEAAAFQFLNLCQGNIVKGLLFGSEDRPTPAQIEKTVDGAVKVFLAAYGVKAE